ncbi:sodium/glutamate symporter [uncultured Shewanella sp.]|uniref:sodium/glutamate symporter n=1 Tax=uncultured Shewanella sp. TaxID=173975 RepID=UPI0026095D31|nr:sodium/glutamate symporter [uncultured Shewanella sp.]
MREILISGADVVILTIMVWFVGSFINSKWPFLERFNIPVAVTGGFLFSLLMAMIYLIFNIKILFDLALRDQMILVFFSTVGLTAKFRTLAAGGKALLILTLVTAVFLILQDLLGVGIATALGVNPGYGLFGGSVSFAGGFGTAIAWGEIAQEAGLKGATEIGIMFATLGLIAGGIVGGPVARFLINKNQLTASNEDITQKPEPTQAPANLSIEARVRGALGTLMILAICVQAGELVNTYLSGRGVTLPGFLTAMLSAIILTNIADGFKLTLSKSAVDIAQEISLQLFLCLSLMSMQLWILSNTLGPVLFVTLAQTILMVFFAIFVVFRFLGRDYQAAVISSGFVGLGLGATPVGIANMNAVTAKHGPSPKAFILVPLVGAFFLDLMNATIIQGFLKMIGTYS